MDCKLGIGTCQQDGWSSVPLKEWYVIVGHLCEVNNHVSLKVKCVSFIGDWDITTSVSIA